MFSHLSSDFKGKKNRIYKEYDKILSSGNQVIDLVSGNVNQNGISYPQKTLEEILREASRLARIYKPNPMGQASARLAIQKFYREREIEFSSDAIMLTPGTSLSYWYLFQLLANPGDEVLCPSPSYPLFDSIARFCGIRLISYSLNPEKQHAIDMNELRSLINPKTKALVLISPHHPTGAVIHPEELKELGKIAKHFHLPILSDEVFSEFLFDFKSLPRVASTQAPLVFTLNGFSKMFGLPGMKIGWIAVSGNKKYVTQAIASLEMMSDTFLSVGELQQFSVPKILEKGKFFLKEYVKTIHDRKKLALNFFLHTPSLHPIPPDGGFYLTLRIKKINPWKEEEEIVLDLLKKKKVLVHPGYFYDFNLPHLVLSFVSLPAKLRKGLKAIADYFQ